MDPGCAPQWVFPAHPPDQITQASIDLRSPYPISRFPTPEGFKAGAMPPQDGFRLNYLGHAGQVRPESGHPYEQCAITAAQPKTRWYPPQGNIELMTEKQILGLKPTPRLEQISDEHYERMQDRKHRCQ
jgi:hypothetical protein